MTCNIGAELLDVSLRDAAHDDGLFDEIYGALLQHRVLFLRDQDISGADHVAFASRMGELEDHPVLPTPDATPGPGANLQDPGQTGRPLREYLGTMTIPGVPVPSKACVLRCVECPPVGGDTMWANMVAAYENLPEDVKTPDRRPVGQSLLPRHRERHDPAGRSRRHQGQVARGGAPGSANPPRDRREDTRARCLGDSLRQLP